MSGCPAPTLLSRTASAKAQAAYNLALMPATDLPRLFAELPAELDAIYDPAAPWALLGDPLDELLAGLPSSAIDGRLDPGAHLVGDRIVISAGARVHAGATLEGPVFIGPDAQVLPGSYIRGGSWLGAGARVGASTEIKRAVLLPGARAPHLNYVGDSILGAEVNLGAGTMLANFRHDGADIEIPTPNGRLATARRKFGALLGDGVKTGCNSVLHPGVIVGRETRIYPGVQLRPGVYPAKSLVKLRQRLEIVEQHGP
jgi:bifunctional UDP-N-acetylglucosamine pyrophosphorylase/glucosamine-1-phosphate N-acetyltransferase